MINTGNEKKREDHDDEREPVMTKNPMKKLLQMFEQLFLFSIFYIHSSPLQPLIGPGYAASDNHFLVHACYFSILMFVPLAYSITNLPGIRSYLSNDASLCTFVDSKETCVDIISDLFTNRFSLAVASMFLLMSLATMKCFARNEYTQPSLHNGFWILKLMFIFVISLITFSIPPALFDYLWQYVCTTGTLIQTIFITFLLLDWTNEMDDFLDKKEFYFEEQHAKQKREKLLLYFAISVIFLVSMVGIAYLIYYAHKHKGFLLVDLLLMVLPLKASIAICLFAQRVASSLLQCAVILCYALFRIGLSMAYGVQCFPVCRAYAFVDACFKLSMVAYGLFRHYRAHQYSMNGSIVYGCAFQTNMAFYNRHSCKQNSQGSKSNSETTTSKELNSEQTITTPTDETAYKTADIQGGDTTGAMVEGENAENQLDNLQNNRCFSSASSYSYSYVHFLLLTACLDTNADLTSFKVIAERNSKFDLSDCRFSLFILSMSSMIVAITFTWSKTVKRFYVNIDEYSISAVLKTFTESTIKLVVRVMTEAPFHMLKVKYIYMGLLLKCIVICLLFLIPSVRKELEKSSLFCSQKTKQGKCLTMDPRLVAIYQVSLSFAALFFILMVMMAGVTRTKNPRNMIHSGFWPSKLLFLGLIFILSFYLPIEMGSVWTHMTLAATLLVILLETITILDTTSNILDHIRVKRERAQYPNKIYFSCSSVAVFLYTLAMTAFFCFYVYFAQFSSCKSNRIFISINLALCILASLISLHPAAQTGGLVQSAIMTSFCMFCTWSALYNNPREQCNPMTLVIFESDVKPTKSLLFTADLFALVATIIYVTVYTRRIEDFLKRFMYLCFPRPCLSSDSLCKLQKSCNDLPQMSFQDVLLGKKSENYSLLQPSKDFPMIDDRNLTKISDRTNNIGLDLENRESNDSNRNDYNLSFFHLLYTLFIMHLFTLMMTWTDERPGSHINVGFHWAIMCVKMVASSVSVLLYIWSLVVHLFWNTSCTYSNSCL